MAGLALAELSAIYSFSNPEVLAVIVNSDKQKSGFDPVLNPTNSGDTLAPHYLSRCRWKWKFINLFKNLLTATLSDGHHGTFLSPSSLWFSSKPLMIE